jgi:putative flavoprotein involved in K+ transport
VGADLKVCATLSTQVSSGLNQPFNVTYECLVIGGGPAGLATSRELARQGVDHVVVERGSTIGHTWANLYDSLILHTGKHLSALPGMGFPKSTSLFPTRLEFLDYLHRYADAFRLPVEPGVEVSTVDRASATWVVRTTPGRELRARSVVLATGLVSNPYVPDIPGRSRFQGRIVHSVQYRRPEPYKDKRVLVVGAGNSAGEIATELAGGGAHVTIAIRSGARVMPRQLLGVPIQYFAVALSMLPRDVRRLIAASIARMSGALRGPSMLPPLTGARCSDIPLIGFHLVDALQAGTVRLKRGVVDFTSSGARFCDSAEERFDEVILATGYRAATSVLGTLVRLDDCGFGLRRQRVISADQPDLYFVGHNYDTRGGLRNIAHDARLAARIVASSR